VLDLLCFRNIFRYSIHNMGIYSYRLVKDSEIINAKSGFSRSIMIVIQLNAASWDK
jgi:hypothetical protein